MNCVREFLKLKHEKKDFVFYNYKTSKLVYENKFSIFFNFDDIRANMRENLRN